MSLYRGYRLTRVMGVGVEISQGGVVITDAPTHAEAEAVVDEWLDAK